MTVHCLWGRAWGHAWAASGAGEVDSTDAMEWPVPGDFVRSADGAGLAGAVEGGGTLAGVLNGHCRPPAITHHDTAYPPRRRGTGRGAVRRAAPRIAGARAPVIRGTDEPRGRPPLRPGGDFGHALACP